MTNATIDTSTPEALMRAFTDRMHAGDIDGLVALYEPSAVFEPQPGVVVRGRDAIRFYETSCHPFNGVFSLIDGFCKRNCAAHC